MAKAVAPIVEQIAVLLAGNALADQLNTGKAERQQTTE